VIWAEFAAIGVMAGFLAGYLGIGGGFVVVPALTIIFSRDPSTAPVAVHLAVATSLSTMLVTSLSSIIAHQRKRAIDWRAAGRLSAGLVLGAVAGAWLARLLDTRHLGMVFGGFALIAAAQLIFGRNPEQHRALPGNVGSTLTGLAIGGLSAMIGIGGGSMTAPWLMWHGVRVQNAVATAAACGYPIALAGTVTFMVLGVTPGEGSIGYVNLPAFTGIAVFSVLAAPLGASAVHRSPAGLVRKAFGVMLVLVAARMLLQAP
jgi:uncharacterized membrane protein YfcA